MDSDDARLERLINQCKNNDVDVKVEALTKLQAEFESGIEINDPDGLINVLKACLRTSNQHLTAATISALPPLLPLLISRPVIIAQPHGAPPSVSSSTSSSAPSSMVDAVTLRQVITAFLPAGGLIERLGDKEKAQAKARETLVILGGLAFRSSTASSISAKSRDGKGQETSIMLFERFLRELGFGSKVWKVREQSILTLAHIRRVHHQFPIRPYLSSLVDALEDTDAHVRDSARQSVVELFSGPAVTDAARADLKKEMTKKGVRKTIVDGVLSKLLASGSSSSNPQSREGSENGDPVGKPKDYVPPSLALQGRKHAATGSSGIPRNVSHGSAKDFSRPASRSSPVPPTPTGDSMEIPPVYIASSRDLENEFAQMVKPFEGKETEHNWAARDSAILRVRGMLKGDVHLRYTDTFFTNLKEGFIKSSLKALASLRTTVSANTCSLYSEFAVALGSSLDPFCDILLTNLLKMAGFTKKIAAQQSQASVSAIIANTSAQPRVVLPLLWHTLQEKTVQARAFIVAHIKQYLEIHGHRSKHAIETSGGLETLEKSLKKALADANPAVRESARVCFWVFEGVWHDRGLDILESLDSSARKQLEKACPNPEVAAVLPAVTPKNTKKSSVAAAIAASRAKAKAIATAPPSLRHQATSASHGPSSRRSASPSASSKHPTARPTSPLRISMSPPSPKTRMGSNGQPRSISTNIARPSHSRSASGGSARAVSPSSPVSERNRTASPLATGSPPNRTSNIRKTMQAALPVSSPSLSHSSSATRNNELRNNAVPRTSALSSEMNGDDGSLLLATAIPIPEGDTDSDVDDSVNLMSFSAPFEIYHPAAPRSNSRAQSLSPKSNGSKPTAGASNTLSSSLLSLESHGGQPVVEDALRARAEQAESAAERLLELVEPEEEGMQHSLIPTSLLVGSGNSTPKVKSKPTALSTAHVRAMPPVTPVNRNTEVMRQAALFKNSPAYNGHSSSLLDVLQERKHETSWWLKRMSLIGHKTPLKVAEASDGVQELQSYITALQNNDADIGVLQKLALLCLENPAPEPPSPPLSPDFGSPNSPSPVIGNSHFLMSLHADMWDQNKNFERLFNALTQFLDPAKLIQSEEVLEYGLIVLWEMMENQAPYIEGREADLFSVLLRVRYCNKLNVLEATNTIRDALTTRIEPVYGLTTMHASLCAFREADQAEFSNDESKAATYAFGLIALGKFILRLPSEVAEEELPRLRKTLISSLTDKSSLVVRESAAASIIAAQLVLRDETHLFTLLDGLPDEKKNLLTYLFDKHGARGPSMSTGPSGIDRLEKEMKRLDTRTSTPPRPGPV